MARKTRKLALVFACLFAVVLVTCVVWMSVNASHACREEQCPICSQMETVESVIKKICSAGMSVQALVVALFGGAGVFAAAAMRSPAEETLVSLKVKLSN